MSFNISPVPPTHCDLSRYWLTQHTFTPEGSVN